MDSRPTTILYIDDQPEAIELAKLALRRIGCQVMGATDGAEGLEIMRRIRPDLVLLDLMLPGWDGWQVRAAMQADEALRLVPVILLTARVAPAGGPNVRQLPQADAYITKPYSLAEIRSTVQSVLSARNGGDA